MSEKIIKNKYLSILIDRFFNDYQKYEYKDYVQFVKEFLEYSESSFIDKDGTVKYGFWKTLSQLDTFIDVDYVPNELLMAFMNHYANNFSQYITHIPYFTQWYVDEFGVKKRYKDSNNNFVYKYKNIRLFLKLSKKFFLNKGDYKSLLFLFKMFDGSCKITPLGRDIIKSSDDYTVLSAPNPKTNRISHFHGIYPDPYNNPRNYSFEKKFEGVDWWYSFYSYEIETNLEEEIYKPLVLELTNPAGMYCVWKTKTSPDNKGWGVDAWGNPLPGNYQNSTWGSLDKSIKVQKLHVDYEDITFQLTSVNTASDWFDIRIRNDGEINLLIEKITISDANNFEINLNGGSNPIGNLTTPALIPFGESKTFSIRFYPKFGGMITANLNINSNDIENNNTSILLTGYAI